jgi:hypothetical protein
MSDAQPITTSSPSAFFTVLSLKQVMLMSIALRSVCRLD